jgi:hypothetical protein
LKRREFIRKLIKDGCFLYRHGSKHDLYLNPRTEKKRNNGCEKRLKQGRAVANPSRAKRKKFIFCIGEVFSLLTRPLMGDPDSPNIQHPEINIETYKPMDVSLIPTMFPNCLDLKKKKCYK